MKPGRESIFIIDGRGSSAFSFIAQGLDNEKEKASVPSTSHRCYISHEKKPKAYPCNEMGLSASAHVKYELFSEIMNEELHGFGNSEAGRVKCEPMRIFLGAFSNHCK
ncbi:hypothetical protein NPIL_552781 [Nephila pilipes]|uniref:Uncharacterized protein n=1 Tax=Nephila pilipes TaxID=299642 RepID=A0A8X6NVM0_NEPPI|nr:hypothetical protein NPIL_552781 [Nephila pilipes]